MFWSPVHFSTCMFFLLGVSLKPVPPLHRDRRMTGFSVIRAENKDSIVGTLRNVDPFALEPK